MFGFLKDKIKGALSKITKRFEEKGKEEVVEAPAPKKVESKPVSKVEVKSVPKVEVKPVEKSKPVVKSVEEKKPVSKPHAVPEKKTEPAKKVEPTFKKALEPVVEEKKTVEKPPVPKTPVVVPKKEEVIAEPVVVKEPQVVAIPAAPVEEKKGFFKKLFSRSEPKETPVAAPKPITVTPTAEPEKKGFFASIGEKITTKRITNADFEELFFELEIVLLENNVAVQVIEKIKDDLKTSIVDVPIKRGHVLEVIQESLKKSLDEVLDIAVPNLLSMIKSKKPYIIEFIGVNGSGKTTNLAKVARYLQKHNLTCVIAACDTFRAAAIQQLEEHATNLNVKLIKHDYGADAAAVAFDAVAHAKSKGLDVVLVDTAGRLHSNTNLMDELSKIGRVIKPDLKIFVGESVTGNDCIEQAMQFDEKIGFDAIILSKADVDEKGGAAISVSYVTKKPILFLGTGQKYDDLTPFSKEAVLASMEL